MVSLQNPASSCQTGISLTRLTVFADLSPRRGEERLRLLSRVPPCGRVSLLFPSPCGRGVRGEGVLLQGEVALLQERQGWFLFKIQPHRARPESPSPGSRCSPTSPQGEVGTPEFNEMQVRWSIQIIGCQWLLVSQYQEVRPTPTQTMSRIRALAVARLRVAFVGVLGRTLGRRGVGGGRLGGGNLRFRSRVLLLGGCVGVLGRAGVA
ncbi:hypothetical protein Pan216_09330 [Planctomycetes bacterium Pan216]|uniref:Uncharacterized protein n=1 Tax=Kolteria novifilia TaxID=2527975 RepID=A0A518AZF6_9BACT|nr:hypothetical protein Pan216_09330 [Planctomycetes bacterium Pan216]